MIAEGNHCDSHFAAKGRAAVRQSANTSGNLSDIYGTMIAKTIIVVFLLAPPQKVFRLWALQKQRETHEIVYGTIKRALSRKGAAAMLETNKPEELENEENFGCVTLTDENGQEADFEILDLILYQEDQYVVLMPLDEEDDQVVILKQEEGDEENDCFVNVESEELLMTIFNIFKERNQDLFDFED